MSLLIVIIIGYVFGCINGSQIVGKYKQINIKQSGMRNAGASNTTILLGWRYGVFVALVDMSKAIISLIMTAILLEKLNFMIEIQILYLYVNALFVIIGHNYPISMSFDGGKGTASFFGVLLFIDWKYAVIGFILLLLTSFITNYFVIGTSMVYVSFITYTAYMFGRGPTFIALLFAIFFMLKHTENFKRIINKEEIKLSTIFRKEAS